MPKRMNDSTKTLWFAGTGIGMLLLAIGTYFVNQPAKRTDFELVGQPFFEEFESSSQASTLEVVALDPDSARMQQFRVEEKNGIWTIPSHNNYPAEASDRLARTSSSLIGLTRESLVGRFAADHERFGVIDPLNEGTVDPESTGKRITLKDGDDEVLVDLIIGKEAGDEAVSIAEMGFDQQQRKTSYYVRHPGELQTYKVALELDLSTKFSDWIRPDLLDLEGAEIKRMDIDNYELEAEADPLGRVARLFKKQGDQMKFSRDSGFGPWTMEELDGETFDLDSEKINTAVTTLDNLKIVGVRKKPTYNDKQILNSDFSVNEIPQEELQENPQQYITARTQLLNALSDNGFNLTPVAQGSQELTIVPNAGQMIVGRGDGVVYTLLFGNAVSGDENEIEIGVSSSDAEQGSETESDETNPDEASDPNAVDAADGSEAEDKEAVKNRFLMIRVDFNEAMLDGKPVSPVEPQEPTKPEGYVAASEKEETPATDQEQATPAENADDATGSEEPNQEPVDDRPEEFKQFDAAMAEFENQKTKYQMDQAKFENDSKQFQDRVEEGKKLVSELNQRFGTWFYVISADNLDSLQLKKDDLVTAKEKPADAGMANPGLPTGPAGLPTRPNINLGNVLDGVSPSAQEPADSEPEAPSESPKPNDPQDQPPTGTEDQPPASTEDQPPASTDEQPVEESESSGGG